MKMKTQQSKTNGCSKSSSKREVYSDKHLRHETQKLSNEQRKIRNKETSKKKKEKKEQAKPKVGRRKEIIKIKTEISETQTKEKTIEKMTDIKSWYFKKILKKENDSSRKKRERAQINKIRKEKEEVKLTPQKYKGSQGI